VKRQFSARHAAVLLAALLLSGCGSTRPVERQLDSGEPLQQPNPAEDRRVHLDLIRRMIEQDQNYAALAHIQAQQRVGNSDELRLLEAEVRRKLGQLAAAQVLYQGLLTTPFASQAYHGLGLITAKRDPAQSLAYLRRAVQLAPTDMELRNDLGFALMLAKRYPEALPELSTAVELGPNSDKSRNNLLILMILMRDERAVQRIVRESNVDAGTLADLRKQAQNMATLPRPAAAAPKPSGAG
jgi:Flp pilus assembly protein TadD